MWQMHADIPLEDQTHEIFWRQLLRWLVSDVPEQVTVTPSAEQVTPGEGVTLLAEVNDKSYLGLNNSRVIAHLTSPSGTETELPMEWTGERDGEFRTRFTPTEQGTHQIRVESTQNDNGETVASAVAYVEAAPSEREFFSAQMRGPLLRRIAKETGGRFYTPETVSSLPEDIRYTGQGTTLVEEKELWDMPIVFLLLIGLIAGEWGYRRKRGLA